MVACQRRYSQFFNPSSPIGLVEPNLRMQKTPWRRE